jgi:cyclophilin family peptidyl-prolyl cis-trans isomerase
MKKSTIIYVVCAIIVVAGAVAIAVGVHNNRKDSTMADTEQTQAQSADSSSTPTPASSDTTTPATAPTTPTAPATTAAASITLPAGYAVPSDCANIDFKNDIAVLNTSLGTMKFQMYASDAPLAVVNFDCLIQRGYYNGIIFHRVIQGFMDQGGDPTGTGTGGASVYGKEFQDELNPATASYKAGYQAGVLAMANAGPNTNGSQFFVMATDYPLPNSYTIFGKIISGMDVVTKINQVQTDPSTDKPLTDVTITSATLETSSGAAVSK